MKRISCSAPLTVYQALLSEITAAQAKMDNAFDEARDSYLKVGQRCIARYHEVSQSNSVVVVDVE